MTPRRLRPKRNGMRSPVAGCQHLDGCWRRTSSGSDGCQSGTSLSRAACRRSTSAWCRSWSAARRSAIAPLRSPWAARAALCVALRAAPPPWPCSMSDTVRPVGGPGAGDGGEALPTRLSKLSSRIRPLELEHLQLADPLAGRRGHVQHPAWIGQQPGGPDVEHAGALTGQVVEQVQDVGTAGQPAGECDERACHVTFGATHCGTPPARPDRAGRASPATRVARRPPTRAPWR